MKAKKVAYRLPSLLKKLKNIASPKDLAEVLIALQDDPGKFYNSREEQVFLEKKLLEPDKLPLAKYYLFERVNTLLQSSPLSIRELAIFDHLMFLSFSVNRSELEAKNISLALLISLVSKKSGKDIFSLVESVPLNSLKFIDFLPISLVLPNSTERYWIKITFSLVDISEEKLIFKDSFSIEPFQSQNSGSRETQFSKLYDPLTGSYCRIKKTNQKLTLDFSLVSFQSASIELSEKIDKPVPKFSHLAFQVADFYEIYSYEPSSSASEVTLAENSGREIFNIKVR